ncbi:RING/FYVE/PHD zinc finger superfamily protein [Melia azedarach]|uniref:RING/FYVE/PHD zinc finger superfamily protein n=1 Tax=Melia azedarach TaxID=155640 RepID=A0ACC1XEJ2_MELAZ|nr:RING/FYVE/PHD zinc finger superfamily protein [Melia azedarach]
MGDHFVLLVDRLLTESTLEAAIESRNRSMQATPSAVDDDSKVYKSSANVQFGDISTPRKLVECRICQDEDEDSNMETPCSCCGSLKYAHRRCVQRWCNEKGNTTCEICHQQFKPGYTAPPPLFQFGHIPMNFRGNWEISRRELNSPRLIAMVSTDRSFLHPPTYEDYSTSNTRNVLCFRSLAIIFMFLLIFRHTLPVILSGTNEYSLPLLLLLLVRTVGIILPIYVMVRVVTALQRRRHQQESPNSSYSSSDEETENSEQSPAQVLHVP